MISGKHIANCFLLVLLLSINLRAQSYSENWPNWRGPNNDGVSQTGTPPTEWSDSLNIKWKTPIPGKGIGTPVIWGDQIFLTTAIELDQKATAEAIKNLKKNASTVNKLMGWSETTENFLRFVVYSINKNTGEIMWEKIVREQFPHESINENGSWASVSCVTDGEHVIASFGSYGIYCFDMEGTLIWERDLGDMNITMTFGEGISPALYKNNLIVLWDHEGQSKLYVLDKSTGEDIWQKDRAEGTTWVTPIVVDIDGNPQIIVPGTLQSMGYDLITGDVKWSKGGLGEGAIPSPVFDGERAYVMTGYGKVKTVQALDVRKLTANSSDSSAVVWSSDLNTSYVPSPLLKDGKLWYLKSSRANLSCVEGKTGENYYSAVKLVGLGGVYASPVWANGYIYIIDRQGTCAVVKEGTIFELAGTNKLDDRFDASPVVVGNDLFLRGFRSLYCVSKQN